MLTKRKVEVKIKRLMVIKLAECKAGMDHLLLLDGLIISSTRHTQGKLSLLIRQAEGVAKNLKLFRVDNLEWSRGGRKLEVKLHEGKELTLDMCKI